MVKKVLLFLNKEFHGINEAALLLGSFTFLSQILGLVRDRLLAHVVGAGNTLDIYYAAFRIPDFLYVSTASLASITVLMPFFVNYLENSDGFERSKKFLSNVFSAFMLCMFMVSIIVYFLLPWLANIIAPGFDFESKKMLISTSRIMLLSPIFIGASNLFGTITQIKKKFFIFSLSPVFYNIGIIMGIIFFYPIFGVVGLSYGVILGAIFHLLIQIPTLIRYGYFPSFKLKIDWKEIYKVVKVSLPRTLTLSCGSLAFIALISLASKLSPGSISLFTFSFNLQSVPVGIIGISYSVDVFPVLVKAYAKKDIESFRSHVVHGIRQIILWSLPTIALFVVLRAQIVRVLLGVNTFSWAHTRLTAASVALFIISLASQAVVLLLVRAYYASGNTKKPLYINIFSSIMIIIFGYILLLLFKGSLNFSYFMENILRVEGVPGTNMLALPFAYALGSLLNVFLLWFSFKKDFLKEICSGFTRTIIEVGFASFVIGLMSYISLGYFDDIFILHTFGGIFAQGFFAGLIGIFSGILVLFLIKNKEYLSIANSISNKIWNKHISIPEQQDL